MNIKAVFSVLVILGLIHVFSPSRLLAENSAEISTDKVAVEDSLNPGLGYLVIVYQSGVAELVEVNLEKDNVADLKAELERKSGIKSHLISLRTGTGRRLCDGRFLRDYSEITGGEQPVLYFHEKDESRPVIITEQLIQRVVVKPPPSSKK